MFHKWKRRRQLQRLVADAKEQLEIVNNTGLQRILDARQEIGEERWAQTGAKIHAEIEIAHEDALDRIQHWMEVLSAFESDVLIRTAIRLGVEIPSCEEKPDWWLDQTDQLSDKGRMMSTKLIRDEKRKTIEWGIKIATPLLSALISILSLAVAVIAMLSR